jgi:hypothetical protein
MLLQGKKKSLNPPFKEKDKFLDFRLSFLWKKQFNALNFAFKEIV